MLKNIHFAMSDNAKKIQDNVPDIDNAGLNTTIETIQKTIQMIQTIQTMQTIQTTQNLRA